MAAGAAGADLYGGGGKCILAPMVRVGGLPFRLTCLEYGADLVFAEEIIAQRLLESTRVENAALGTTDFLDENGSVCFRTCSRESERVVFQMGVSCPEVAVKAAKIIEPYVAGIDVNMGCPKSYSIKGNMGAALLTQPDLVRDILAALVKNCSKPVTAKIRILPEEEDTMALCRVIEGTGVAALTVHGRTATTRSSAPCDYGAVGRIKKALSIPVFLNGASLDIKERSDLERWIKETGVDGIMVARAAWHNPAIFSRETVPASQAAETFLKRCIDYECPLNILKYTIGKLQGLLTSTDGCLQVTRHIEPRLIYKHFGLADYYDKVTAGRISSVQDEFQRSKRQKLGEGHILLTEQLTPTILQTFRSTVAPRQILNQWLIANGFSEPSYWTVVTNKIFTGYLRIDNDTFVMEGDFKNKRTAIQAVAYAYCMKNHIELRHYKTGPKTNR